MANLSIQRSLGQRRSNLMSIPRSSGVREYTPEDISEDTDVPVHQSVISAVRQSGIITGGIAAMADEGSFTAPEFDPEFDMGAYVKGVPEYMEVLQPALDDPDNPNSAVPLAILMEARNQQHVDDLFRRFREAQETTRLAKANGTLPEVVGMVAGIGIDIAATIALLGLTGGGAAPAGLAGGAARLAGAGRLAALAAAEGAGERAVQRATNPLIPTSDIWLAAGFGAAFGGLLGGLAPHRLAGVSQLVDRGPLGDNVVDVLRAEREAVGAQVDGTIFKPFPDEGGGSAGAAIVDDVADQHRIQVPGKGAGSVAARFVPHGLAVNALRNLKRVVTDIGVAGNKSFQERGWTGQRRFYDQMSRLLRFSIANESEVAGQIGKRASADQIRLGYNVARAAREESSRQQYAAAAKEVFDMSGMARALRNNDILQIGKRGITHEEFEALGDKLARYRTEHETLGGVQDVIWAPDLMSRTTSKQRTDLLSHITKHADAEDTFYQEFGQLQVEAGVLKAEDLVPGYRPQRWNKEMAELDAIGLENFWLDVMAKRPDEDWLTARGWLTEDETWDTIRKGDPERRDEVLDDWARAIKSQLEDRKLILVDAAQRELKRAKAESLEELVAKVSATVEKDVRILEKHGARLAKLTARADREVLAIKIGKVEKRIADKEAKLERVQRAMQSVDDLDRTISRLLSKGGRKAITKAEKKLGKAIEVERKAVAAPDLKTRLEQMRLALLDKDDPFGLPAEHIIETSSRFKRRTFHLGEHALDERADRFLLTNTGDARRAFVSSVGTQLAMRRAFNITPELLQGSPDTMATHLRNQFMEGFATDLRRSGLSEADKKLIFRDKVRAEKLFDKLFAEFTHGDIVMMNKMGKGIADVVGIANTATAAMSLGRIAFSLIGDLAVQMQAGGRAGTGFQVFWRSKGTRKIMREIFESGEQEMAVLMQGLSVMDAARFRAIAELDLPSLNVPGGKMAMVARKTSSVAVLEGWANLMHVWNQQVRGGFGLDFMRQMDADFARYDTLPDYLKTYYAKVGINGNDAKSISRLLKEKGRTFVNGALRVPDSNAWSKARPDLLSKYKQALQAAGDEAMIDPAIGDRPFLRSFPGGRMIMQFQSFMFTAGERFIAPMIQEIQMHPTSIRPYMAAWMGVQLGIFSDGLRAGARGEGPEWMDRWGDPTGIRDNLTSGILRSPMMAGPSAMLSEVAMRTFGRPINDLIEAGTGVRPISQAATRFREQQAIYSLLGPSVGQAATGITIGKRVLEGDFERAVDMAGTRMPLFNVFYIQSLMKLGDL